MGNGFRRLNLSARRWSPPRHTHIALLEGSERRQVAAPTCKNVHESRMSAEEEVDGSLRTDSCLLASALIRRANILDIDVLSAVRRKHDNFPGRIPSKATEIKLMTVRIWKCGDEVGRKVSEYQFPIFKKWMCLYQLQPVSSTVWDLAPEVDRHSAHA